MTPIPNVLSYDDRNEILQFWMDAGIHFDVVDDRLQIWSDHGAQHVEEVMDSLRPHFTDLKEEVGYQRWAEQSLEARGLDLARLEFYRWAYEQGQLHD